jgi:hypothetical protein
VHGRGQVADDLRSRLIADADRTPSIVVVGEAKRGKSSLINAMLGVPDLAAVGTDIVTGAYVRYVPPTVEHDLPPGTARVHLADGSHEAVPLHDVAAWVSVGGERASDDRGVVGATVRLADPGPLEAVVVDTPGVSGLVAGHGQLALTMARSATALLFVTDAGQDFTAPEATFLEQAAAQVDTVVVAATKVDKHPVSWERVLAHDRELLARHAPRFANAPILGVSAVLATEALSVDDEDVSRVLTEDSRIGELLSILGSAVSERGERLAWRNAARGAVTQLAQVEAELDERIEAVKDAASAAPKATAEQEAIEDLRRRERSWGESFHAGTMRARRALVTVMESTVPTMETAWKGRLSHLTDDTLRNQVQLARLCGELAAELEETSDQLLAGFVADLSGNIAEVLDEDAARVRALSSRIDEAVELSTSLATVDFEATGGTGQPFAELLVRHSFMGFGAANMVGALGIKFGLLTSSGGMLGGAAALGPFMLPVAAAAALGMTFMTHKRQQVELVRRQLLEHVLRSIARLRADVIGRADAVAAELRPELMQAVRDHLDERIAQLQTVREEALRAQRSAPRERQRQVQDLVSQRRKVAAARSQLEAQLASTPDVGVVAQPAVPTGRRGGPDAAASVWGMRPGTP